MKNQIAWEIDKIAISFLISCLTPIFLLFCSLIMNHYYQNIFFGFFSIFFFKNCLFIFYLIFVFMLFFFNNRRREKIKEIEEFEKYPWNEKMFEIKGWDNYFIIPSKEMLYEGVFKYEIKLSNSDPFQFLANLEAKKDLLFLSKFSKK